MIDPYAFPGGILEVEFTDDVWTDITHLMRGGFALTRGRPASVDRTETGHAEIPMNAYGRELEPQNRSSPYWPNVRPHKRARMAALVDGVRIPLFTDWHIESWGIDFPQNGFDESSTIVAVDAFGALARAKIKLYADEVMADKPDIYYQLDELAGSVTVDGVGGPTPVNTGRLGVEGPLLGQGTAWEAATSPGTYVGVGGAGSPPPIMGLGETGTVYPGTTFEFWIYLTSYPLGAPSLMSNPNPNAGTLGSLNLVFNAGQVTVYGGDIGGPGQFAPVTDPGWTIPLGVWTHIVVTRYGGTGSIVEFYRNGALVGSPIGSPTSGTSWPQASVRGPLQIGGSYNNGEVVCGRFAHAAAYSDRLPPARIFAHYNALQGSLAPGTTGEQIDGLLDAVGFDPSERDIDAGVFGVSRLSPSSPPLPDLLGIAAMENGLVFHESNGDMTYFDRTHQGRSGVVFGTASGVIRFEDITLAYDGLQIENQVTVNAPDLPQQTVDDIRSQERYRAVLSDPTLVTRLVSPADMALLATSRLVDRREPRLRIAAIDHVRAQTDWADILDFTLLDSIVVDITPPGGGDPIVQDSRIEQIRITSGTDQDWQIHWDLSALPRVNLLEDQQIALDLATLGAAPLGWLAETNVVITTQRAALAGLNSIILTALADGDVAILSDPSQQVSVTPGEFYFANAVFQSMVSQGVEIQDITLTGFAGSDNFQLRAEGTTTVSFTHGVNATAAAIQAALRSATGDAGLTVTGTTDIGPFRVTWSDILNQPTIAVVNPVGCTVVVTTNRQGYASTQCHVELSWRGVTGAEVSKTSGAEITDIAGTWIGAYCEGAAPGNAAYVCVRLVFKNVGQGQNHFADLVLLTVDD